MIYQNVELHGIEELISFPGSDGVLLQRVPEKLRVQLNEFAQRAFRCPGSAEIRFVTDSPTVRMTLSCPEAAPGLPDLAEAIPFFGMFQSPLQRFIITEKQTIEISFPKPLQNIPDGSEFWKMPFSPRVWRLVLGRSPVLLHSIEGDNLRPPTPEELPRLRYLTYGTSITHGSAALGPHISYVAQTARRLGADLINLGVGGGAMCEPEVADYIAARNDWDFATLELSVNMVGRFTGEEFRERVRYMINTVAGTNIQRPVACISLHPYYGDLGEEYGYASSEIPAVFRRILRAEVESCPYPNVHFIEGPALMTDFGGLASDLLHPADNGMIQIGENLAKRLRPIVEAINKVQAKSPA